MEIEYNISREEDHPPSVANREDTKRESVSGEGGESSFTPTGNVPVLPDA